MSRVALIGTFDSENYGDILFPFIFTGEIHKRINNIEIDYFGPYGAETELGKLKIRVKGLIDTSPRKVLSEYDCLIIGGVIL